MRVVPTEKKKIQLIPEAIICHIDETSLFGYNENSAEILAEHMKNHFSDYEYHSHRLEDIFKAEFKKNPNFDKIMHSTCGGIENRDYEHPIQFKSKKEDDSSAADQLKTLFSNIKSTTAKEELLWNLKMEMLVTIARREGCSYIFMGDSATRQAIKMISMTSKGRGYSVALDVSVDDQQSFSDLCIMRPMKDMLSKEIGFYNFFTHIDKLVVSPFNFSTMMPGKNSIDRLTEEFIISIEREFSSTVSTICRTIMKLNPTPNIEKSSRCSMCLAPFEADIQEWRKHITVADVKNKETTTNGCGDCGNGCNSGGCSNDNGPIVDLNRFLCYSCQVNLKDYNETSIQSLPPYISENLYEQSTEKRLLSQIKDFLIDDDE